jgi:quinol-cytochrome oxidoreductase complex cytochrome b subunit
VTIVPESEPRNRWRTATRVAIVTAAFLLVVLVASGAWLWWNYFPGNDEWIRDLHQVAAVALLVVAVAVVALAILQRVSIRASGVVASVGVLLTVGASYVTGRLLPWDQMALWAVVTRRDFPRGVAATFDDRVKFLILGIHEVSPSTYHWWAFAHLALSALVVVALVMVWLRARDRDVSRWSPPAREPEPAPEPVE